MEKFWRDRKTADEVQVIKIIILIYYVTHTKVQHRCYTCITKCFQHLKTMLPLKSSVCINE